MHFAGVERIVPKICLQIRRKWGAVHFGHGKTSFKVWKLLINGYARWLADFLGAGWVQQCATMWLPGLDAPPPPSLPPQWNAKDPLQEHLLDSFLSVWVVKKELFGLFGDIKLKQAVCTSLFGRWNLALAHYRSETCMVLSSCNLLAKLCSTVEPVLNTLKIWVAWMADCLCYVNPWCHVVNGKRL